MSKLSEYIKEQPVIKKFGISGIVIALIVSAFTAIFQDEMVKLKDWFVAFITEQFNDNKSDSSDASLVSAPAPADDTEYGNMESENPESETDTAETDVPETEAPQTDEPVTDAPETDEPETDSQTPSAFTELNGRLDGEDSREESYRPLRTGKYRFDFDIDDVNKSYYFCILDSTQEEVARGHSSDQGVTVNLDKDMDYKLLVEHDTEDEYVDYDISINVPNEVTDIESQSIDDKITYTDQENEYKYTAPKSGIYRFDFDINDVNNDYLFLISNEKNEELIRTYYSEDGGTLELSAGKAYKIKVVQTEGMPEYSIKINEPNEPKPVQDNLISGSIHYTDQNDIYNYVPPRTGRYRFDFDIDDVNKSYKFLMFDSKRTEIARKYSSDEGQTIELQEGKNYEIQIIQCTDFADYTVNIHTPTKAKTIYNGTSKGSINFTDQQNIYYFTADKSTEYKFNFISNNVDNSFRISMYDSQNREIINTYGSNEERTIELKKNKKYKLYITYSQGFGKYKINISR